MSATIKEPIGLEGKYTQEVHPLVRVAINEMSRVIGYVASVGYADADSKNLKYTLQALIGDVITTIQSSPDTWVVDTVERDKQRKINACVSSGNHVPEGCPHCGFNLHGGHAK